MSVKSFAYGAAVLAVILVFVAPVKVSVIGVFLAAALVFDGRRSGEAEAKLQGEAADGIRRLVGLMLIFATAASVLDPVSWLPLEKVSMNNGRQLRWGYVLKVDQNSIVILDERPRKVEYFNTSNVTRQICTKPAKNAFLSFANRSLYPLIFNSGFEYPRC